MPTMEPRFEIFDHTADAGIRITAPSLPELIRPATDGLYACIGELVARGQAESFLFDRVVPAPDAAILLRDYLQELLLTFETHHCKVTVLDVPEFTPTHLAVAGRSEPVDPDESIYDREVKAVTYHELAIREVPGGVMATVIVDI